jgi:hypothetical protein
MLPVIGILTLVSTACALALGQISLGAPVIGVILASAVIMSVRA